MLEAAKIIGRCHVPSALSILDIIYVLYFVAMKAQDRFVLSKGHGCLALYVTLVERGLLDLPELLSMGKFDSPLGGHPDCNKIPNVEFSTGSLGHGFPMAVGLAMAMNMRGENGRVFCLVGDGECNEGSVAEAAALAVRYRLDNLVLIVDRNHSDAGSLGNIADRYLRAGWWVFNAKGHDHDSLANAFDTRSMGQPLLVVADTIKGYGVIEMERYPQRWHYARMPQQITVDR